jgi:hypothetical protein
MVGKGGISPGTVDAGGEEGDLDLALGLTFPASDPIAVFRPERPALPREARKTFEESETDEYD